MILQYISLDYSVNLKFTAYLISFEAEIKEFGGNALSLKMSYV